MPKARRAYPFPKPRLAGSRGSRTFSDRLYSWLVRSSWRMMHARQRASQPLPDQAELAAWMYGLACEHGDEYFDSEYDTDGVPNKYRLSYERLERKCHEAAEASLLGFDPGYLALQAARGRKSKRPPVFALDILDSVQGLSITEQAAKLGISVSTVSRRRRQALASAKLPPVITGDPGWDALLADLD